jgi:hypothetical protein
LFKPFTKCNLHIFLFIIQGGLTILNLAKERNRNDIISYLLEDAFISSCKVGRDDMASYLLESGAQIDVQDKVHKTSKIE